MQFLFLFVAAFAAFSCSKDDDKNDILLQPAPVATKLTTQGFSPGSACTYELSFDGLRRVSEITVTGGTNAAYTITYNDIGLLGKVNISGANPQIILFGYDANKRLNQLTVNGAVSAVSFNEATGVYTHASHTFILADNGDIQNLDGSSYLYDDSDKGAFANVNSNFELLAIFIDPTLQYACTKNPVASIISGATNTYVNEFDAAGYIVLRIVQICTRNDQSP